MQIKHAQNTSHFAYSHSRLARNLVLVDNEKSKLKKTLQRFMGDRCFGKEYHQQMLA